MDFDRGMHLFERPGSDIRMKGCLKKLKTMKKKFFVLRSTSSSGPARLEYYDSEKKFNAGHLPKRAIHLHTCFNINRKSDGRHKYAIALYTKEDCFSVICEDEKEQDTWLSLMLDYQNEYVRDGEHGREHYEHVWQITVQPKGLGQTKNMRGHYRLCLTCQNICFIKLNSENPQFIFQLETVRSLAHSDNLFRMEVGKIAPTGEGELWMQADDNVNAQNLHETILSYMKNMDRRLDGHQQHADSMHFSSSSSTLPRQLEFRNRTASESHTHGSCPKGKPRPMSACSRSTTVSPGTSPHSFTDHVIMGTHRVRSDSNDSKASRNSMSATEMDMQSEISPLEEESDGDGSVPHDLSNPSSPGFFLNIDQEEYSSSQLSSYVDMRPGSSTPPSHAAPSGSGYMDMAAGTHKEMTHSSHSDSSSYMAMNPARHPTSVPVPIHPGYESSSSIGYMDMSGHTHLPPVKEGGSNEGYLPMSPLFGLSPSSSSAGYPHPEQAVCMLLSDDSGDFCHPPTRTYSLGSRPVKPVTKFSGYMDMSGRKGVSDNGRSCSAPHLITHHPHQGRSTTTSSRTSNMDSPTPSASPLSTSMKSDDSDSFMELDFYRPRTASDSYSYRPRSSSFGLSQGSQAQPHRPRSSSHGQGTRPVRQNRLMGSDSARMSHEMLQRLSQNSSMRGSYDSLKVSSSESLRKLSLEVRAKTSQLSNNEYIDMSFEKRHTPSPQPGSGKQGENGYVDMTLGSRRSSPSRTKSVSRSNSKASSSEKLHDSDYTTMSYSGGSDSIQHHIPQDSQQQSHGGQGLVYINMDLPDQGLHRQDPVPQSSSSKHGDSYISCEPAALAGVSGADGSKTDSGGQGPRNRSGSEGKEQKKKGFFHRHTHGDAAKRNSKRADQIQASGASSFDGGIGQVGIGVDRVAMGHDIRQKKTSSTSRSGSRKSVPFASKSLDTGSSSSKPIKLMKSVTPPKGSLDSMDEYIEFVPTATKSDSDSSHSSGSAHASAVHGENIVAAKTEPDYIGFEPGKLFSSRGSSGGGYVRMGDKSHSGTVTSFFSTKPMFSGMLRRSKSKEENAAASSLPTSIVTTPTTSTVSGAQDAAAFVPQYNHAVPRLAPAASSAAAFPQRPQSANVGFLTSAAAKLNFGSEATPSRSASSLSSSSSHSSQSLSSASSVTVAPSSLNSSPSSVTKVFQAQETNYLNFDPKKFPEETVGIAAKAKEGEAGERKSLNIKAPAWDRTLSTSVKSVTSPVSLPTSPAGLALTSKPELPVLPTPSAMAALPTSARVEQSPVLADCSSLLLADSSRSSSAGIASSTVISQESHVRKMSGSGSSSMSAEGPTGNTEKSDGKEEVREKDTNSCSTHVDSGALNLDKPDPGDACSFSRNSGSGAGVRPKEVKTPSLRPSRSSAPQLDASFGLTRPDSATCVASGNQSGAESSVCGLGRGRHSSSNSQGDAGDNGGTVPINPGTTSRHSLTDLSGYEKMSFPSDALLSQQPAHYQNQAHHQQQQQQQSSPSQQQSLVPGCAGQGKLNYATLDLGSADSVGEGGDSSRSPRNKSRHPSSADEKGDSSSYATIDFLKSENLRNSGNKEVKFTL